MIMILDVDVTAERRHYNTHRPLKGKRLTTFCASLALLHPLLSLTHWIFRSLMLPYKSSSHSAKCVRCASLRSGGRRLAVRKMIECHISAQPRTPFASSRRSPQGETRSMERKNRESYISCTIPQFPPLVVNAVSQSPECVSCHMAQKGKSRNADFISIARRAIHNPRPEGPSNLRTLRPIGPVNPKNLFLHNPSTQPAADRRLQPSGQSPVNPHSNGVSGRVK